MYKKVILGGLFTAFLGFSLSAQAECPDEQYKCADGIHGVTLNTKWSWSKFSCVVCFSGCGRGVDNLYIPYCAPYGGAGKDEIEGVGVGLGAVTSGVGDVLEKAGPAIGAIAKAAG